MARYGLPKHIVIERSWDGAEAPAPTLHATLELREVPEGLSVIARAPHQPSPCLPEAPVGHRVADLWRYDVVELFLVGADIYLELELGPEGRYLALDFDGVRQRRRAFADWWPKVTWMDEGRGWVTMLTVPHEMIPRGLEAMNAFAILSGEHLAWHPLPGPKPDYHQPDRFPRVRSV
ncbi:MAG: hypothetical protein ACE366_00865 [Bradymonadia bacterium]